MCGICGALSFTGSDVSDSIRRLVPLMARRGPDDQGFWSDGSACALGFRRLSVLDPTPAGHQPMLSRDGRYALVYNGEVYNFKELRHELEEKGFAFSSTGDTEVVLAALIFWGKGALERFNGMFALAFYDARERRLLLARDHAGIKPLYYLKVAAGIAFASQYDQILAHPFSHGGRISSAALGLYLRLAFIPAPYGLLEGSHMLEPGSWLECTAEGRENRGRYFEFPASRPPDLHGPDADEQIDAAVTAAVKRQLVSDVPLGVFLSGGIDSPLVAAKMRANEVATLQAFTIGVRGEAIDESADATAYARELGVEHHLQFVTEDDALALVDDVVDACGEPFADFSIFPTLLVCRLARTKVTVMLSGDGGDEMFWGYAARFASVIGHAEDFRQPPWLRSARWGAKKLFGLGSGHPDLRWPSIGEWYRARHAVLRDHVLEAIFEDPPAWPEEFPLFDFRGGGEDAAAQWCRWNEFVGRMTMILLKVDRASMHESLEVRVPLLDREVVGLAARIDWRSCLDTGRVLGKLPLRHSLARTVRHQTQSKRGFTVPMAKWLRGPLRDMFESVVLDRQELAGRRLRRGALAEIFRQHLAGETERAWGLWTLLSLALWEDRHYRPAATRPAIATAL